MALWQSINKLSLSPFFLHPISLGVMISLNGLKFLSRRWTQTLWKLYSQPENSKGGSPYQSIPISQQTCYTQQALVCSNWKPSFLISRLSQKQDPQGRPHSSKEEHSLYKFCLQNRSGMEQLLFFPFWFRKSPELAHQVLKSVCVWKNVFCIWGSEEG